MKTTQIKRLYQTDTEFVPITLSEAVVVNATNIPGLKTLGITTLDKVLNATLGVVNQTVIGVNDLNTAVEEINTTLSNKQDKLKAGAGITIAEDGTISSTSTITELYKIVDVLPTPDVKYENIIFLTPASSSGELNGLTEYLCIYHDKLKEYVWEQIGTISTDVDLSEYVTSKVFKSTIEGINTSISTINTALGDMITAEDVTTSSGEIVSADYEIPKNLYDNI